MSEAVHDLLNQERPDALFVSGDFPLDESVLDKLPNGSRVLSANRFGTSAWTVTARLNVALPEGKQARYFLKCAAEERGRIMMEGEFNAMAEIYKTMPTFVPEPLA
jgi:protein-ribulosamine 3-kinase